MIYPIDMCPEDQSLCKSYCTICGDGGGDPFYKCNDCLGDQDEWDRSDDDYGSWVGR
tara:strand:- start:2641 stop:2811 length:171 start_codon:yes stop_codon:yes gene_type:complete